MRRSATKLWLAIGTVALGACSCPSSDQCSNLVITFDSPKDGDTVPATTDLSVSVVDGSAAADLSGATLCTRLLSGTECSLPITGTVAGGKATFTGVPLEAGANFVEVSVQKTGASCTAKKNITLNVADTMPPKVLTFTFPQDLNGDQALGATELPAGTPLQISLTTQGVVGGTVEIVSTAAPTAVLATAPVTASGVVLAVPAAALPDGAFTFFAHVTRNAVDNTQSGNPEAVASITIARAPPTCALTAPVKAVVGPGDDADPAKAGYQLRVSGTGSGSVKTIELKLAGGAAPQTSGAKPVVAGGLSADFDVAATGTTLYTVTLEAKDAAGNVCTATKMVTVDLDAPTCVITSPTAASSPYASFAIPLTAMVTGAEGGTVQFSTTLPSVRDLSPPLLVTAGSPAAYTGAFVAGAQTVTAECVDLAGNVATATQAITVNATGADGGSAGCSIYFVRPATKPALITSAAYTVIVQSSCPTTPITLKQTGVTPDKTVNSDASGVALFNLSGLVNGTFTLTASVGSAPTNSDKVDVTVDLNAPVITRPLLASGKTYALLNVAADLAPATAGAQAQLAYTATVPAGARVDVCSNQNPAPMGAGGLCADGLAGWWTLKSNAAANEPTFTFPEGAYSLKLVVVMGTTVQATSAPLDVLSDVTAPVLTNFKFVRDANGDKLLNIAEISAMPIQTSFDLGAGNTAASVVSVAVKDAALTYNTQAGVVATGQSFTVTLNQNLTAPVQLAFPVLTVTATDNAGNSGSATMTNAGIDQVAPACAITQPSSSLLGAPNDASATTAGFQLGAQVGTDATATTVAFSLGGAQTATGSATSAGGIATFNFTLTQSSGVQSYDVGATCTDLAGNATVAPPRTAISVDLAPPTCTLTAPAASPPSYLTYGVATSVTVTGASSPSAVRVYSQVGAAARTLRANLPIVAGAASGVVSYGNGTQAVTAEVDDAAGNTGTCGPVSITVAAPGCDIVFTSPVISNGKYFLTAIPFTVTGHSSNCGAGKTVRLLQVGNVTALGSGTTNASGDVSIQGSLVEGANYTLRLEINDGAGALTVADLNPVVVDVTPPAVGVTTPTGATLTFVSATNVNSGATFIQDLVPGAPADFTVSVANITGGVGGQVAVFFKGAMVGTPVAITTDPQTVTFNTSLPHNDTGAFEIRVSDQAGNVTKPTVATATIDVVAPAAPTVTLTRADARAATMALSWGPTYDDGSTVGSGAHAGYDIRWSTDAVTGANQLATSADYFSSAKANTESLEPWSASTINRTLTLPPLNNYYIVVRAKDEVGNYSAYVAPTAFDNNGTQDGLVNPNGVGSQFFGGVVVVNGSLNGDAFDDLVVPVPLTNTVYVYFGGPGFAPQTTCVAPRCQAIVVPGTPNGDNFGFDVSVGNVGDTAAPDLLVSSDKFSANLGRVFLFFGGANPIDTVAPVEFRGTIAGALFGYSAQVIPDINNDGYSEIAVYSNEGAGRGRVYIFKGRSKAAWLALAVAGGGTIPPTSADAIIDGPTPNTATNYFGTYRGQYAALGDLSGDGVPDFAIASSQDTVHKVFLFSGATVAAATVAAPLTTGVSPGTPSQTLQELTMTGNSANSPYGFGYRVLGGTNFFGATGNDLLVAQPLLGKVFLYGDVVLPAGAPNITLSGGAFFGITAAIATLRGGTVSDVIVGENHPSSPSPVTVFFGRQGGFDAVAGAGFWQARAAGPASATNGIFAGSIATGDFDGDGKPDIAIADPATGSGRVMVWH